MSPLVEFPLEAGGTVLVQVARDSRHSGAVGGFAEEPVTRGRLRDQAEELTQRAGQTLDAALGTVQPAAEALLSRLTHLTRVPDEVAVEFAIELSAEAGAFITALGTSAHFKIALKWRRPGTPSAEPVATDAAQRLSEDS